MKILAFDTSLNFCSVAIMNDCVLLGKSILPMPTGQAEALIPAINSVLDAAKIKYEDLGLIAVIAGPGSFTGIRVGLAAARSMGMALDIPCIGLSSTNVMAAQIKAVPKDCQVLAVIETKRDDFYFQIFNDALAPITDVETASAKEIMGGLSFKNVVLAGDAMERFIVEAKNTDFNFIKTENTNIIDPEILARLAYQQFKSGVKIEKPAPLYAKEADTGGGVPKH